MTNLDNFLGGFTNILQEQYPEDLQLRAGRSDKSAVISVHKLALAARSKVFKKMFQSEDFKSCNVLQTVTLWEMTGEELEAFVKFIYSNGSFSSETLKMHVKSLYMAAYKYEIPHLRDVCRNELISSLNTLNALEVLEFSQIPFDKLLNDAAVNFIATKLKTISSSREFKLFIGQKPDLMLEIMKILFDLIGKGQRIH